MILAATEGISKRVRRAAVGPKSVAKAFFVISVLAPTLTYFDPQNVPSVKWPHEFITYKSVTLPVLGDTVSYFPVRYETIRSLMGRGRASVINPPGAWSKWHYDWLHMFLCMYGMMMCVYVRA